MNNSSYFSTQLAKIITASGKSQKEISMEADISETKLSKLLSGKLNPQYEDILKFSEILKMSPSYFFDTETKYYPFHDGFVLDTRVYTFIYNNPIEGVAILVGRAFDSGSFVPVRSLPFLSHLKDNSVFSLTPIRGEIKIKGELLKTGAPVVLDGISEIYFSVGSIYLLQIVGMTEKFNDFMRNHLPIGKSIQY